MEKTIKLRSQFLPLLNESLRKLTLNDEVKKVSPVIVEADGKFTSIVKADDNFDPASLDSNIEAEEENEETKETKQQLLNRATDSLKQTIQNSKELDEILQKIKKLSQEDGFNEWVVNDKGNTASLKSKNAYIFKQNDNLCLSHNGKVELFKSVCELRKWLEDNNYPLPKDNIEIHESVITEDGKKKINNEPDEDWNWVNLLDFEKDEKLKNIQKDYDSKDHKNDRIITKQDIGLSKAISKQDYQNFSNVKKPVKLKTIHLDDSMDECFAGVATANLGPAVAYLGNKKVKKSKKKEEKENLEEANWFIDNAKKQDDYVTTPLPKGHTKSTQAKQIYSTFANNNKYNAFLNNPDHELKNKEGLKAALEHMYTDDFKKHLALRRQDTILHDTVKKYFQDEADKVIAQYNLDNTTKNDVINNLISNFSKDDLINLENYLKSLAPQHTEWESSLQDPNLFTMTTDGKTTVNLKNNNKAFFKEWILNRFANENVVNKDYSKEFEKVTKRMKDFIDGNLTTVDQLKTNVEKQSNNSNNLSNEDIMLLRQHNVDVNDPFAPEFLKVLKQTTESANNKLNIKEAANKYPWLNKLMGQRLVEDDTPADFATGSPISSDMDAATTDTTASSADSGMDPTSDMGVDFAGEAEQNGFGDVDISVGGGYSPEDEVNDEQAMPAPNMPEYKIIDVLTNEDNPNDVKVKVQDVDTKKSEIKNLDEIDV